MYALSNVTQPQDRHKEDSSMQIVDTFSSKNKPSKICKWRNAYDRDHVSLHLTWRWYRVTALPNENTSIYRLNV